MTDSIGVQLRDGLTVAMKMPISDSSTEIKNVYSKLNVHSRAEAVQRAEELGLIRGGAD